MSATGGEPAASTHPASRGYGAYWWIGLVLIAVCTVFYVWLIVQAIADAPPARSVFDRLENRLSDNPLPEPKQPEFPGAGALVLVGLILGVLCAGIGDVTRRSTQPMITIPRRVFAYPVRPVSVGWQILWIGVLVVVFLFIDPVQRLVGILSSSAPTSTALQVLVSLPALAISAAAGAATVSLIKKLSYAGQLRRHPKGSFTYTQRGAWSWLFVWRTDLAFGAVAGVLLGSVASFLAVGQIILAGTSFFFCLIFGGVAVLLAFQFWRTGESLAVTTIPAPRSRVVS